MAMTQTEFRAAVKRHGYSLADFAEEFGVAYDTARKWGGHDLSVPRWATRVLTLMDQLGRGTVAGRRPAESSGKAAESSGTRAPNSATLFAWQESPSKQRKRNSSAGSTPTQGSRRAKASNSTATG